MEQQAPVAPRFDASYSAGQHFGGAYFVEVHSEQPYPAGTYFMVHFGEQHSGGALIEDYFEVACYDGAHFGKACFGASCSVGEYFAAYSDGGRFAGAYVVVGDILRGHMLLLMGAIWMRHVLRRLLQSSHNLLWLLVDHVLLLRKHRNIN